MIGSIQYFIRMGCVNESAYRKRESVKAKDDHFQEKKLTENRQEEAVRQINQQNLETEETNNLNQQEVVKDTGNGENLNQFVRDCELCYEYYQQHDLDSAMVYLEKINHQIDHVEKLSQLSEEEKQKLKKMKELIPIIQAQYNDMISYDNQIKRGGWIEKSNKKGVKVSTRREEEGTVGALIQSIIDVPFEVFISVLIEMELYKDFIPFMKVSKQQKQFSRNCRLGYAQNHFPILNIRQAFFQGIGYNRLHKDNSVFLYTRSIHNREDLQKLLGYKCDVNEDYVQLEYKYFVIKYEPIDKIRGNVTLAMNVDIRVSFIPMWIQDMISQDYGEKFFSNIVEISKKFKGSKWEQNVKKNPHLFNFFKDSLENHLKTMQDK